MHRLKQNVMALIYLAMMISNSKQYKGVTMATTEIKEESELCKPRLNVHTINIKGCKPNTIQNFECSGQCFSDWKALASPGETTNHCTACLPSKKLNRVIFIDCYGDKPRIPVTVTMSMTCQCQKIPCGGRGLYTIQ